MFYGASLATCSTCNKVSGAVSRRTGGRRTGKEALQSTEISLLRLEGMKNIDSLNIVENHRPLVAGD